MFPLLFPLCVYSLDSLIESNKTGRDFVTGLTESEQTEVNKEYVELLAEERKKGTVDKKQESALYEEAEKRVTNAQYRANVSIGKEAMAHKNFQAEFQGVLEQALLMPKNSEAYHLAVAAQKKIANGKQLSEAEVGALYRETAMEVVKAEKNAGEKGTELNIQEESTSVNTDPAQHTPQEQAVIEEYQNAVDDNLVEYIQVVRDNPGQTMPRYSLKNVSNRAAEDIKRLTGVDVSGNRTQIEARMIEHIIKDHGENGLADHSMRDLNDIARIQYVIDNYDSIEHGGTSSAYVYQNKYGRNANAQTVIMKKKVNGTYFVVEAVPDTSKKTVFITSAYMSKDGTNKSAASSSGNAEAPRVTSETATKNTADLAGAYAPNPIIANDSVTVNTEGGNQNGETTGNQPIGAANIAAGEGSTGGTAVSDGEQRGPAGTGAHEQAAPVAGATGQSQRADGRRAAFERQNRIQAIRDSVRDAIPVSPREVGIPGGSTDTTMKIVPIAYQTEEMKNVSDWFEERGVRAYFFVGSLSIQQGGKDFIANGVLNGDYVFIKADSPNFDLEQIAEHEKFHLIKRGNPGLVEQLVHELQELPEADFSRIVDKYIKAYGSIVDMSRDGAELRIWNEILADAYAGMNARGVDVAAYQDEVVQRVQKYTGEGRQAQDNGVRQTNGPNSQTVENGEPEYSLSANARTDVHDVLTNKNYSGEVKLTDTSPSILLTQKGVKNLPMLMNASHIRENVFTAEEAKAKGLRVNPNINYHGLGEDLFLKVIDDLDNVKVAYRGTKNADNPARRENYFLLISQQTDKDGNVINVPVFVNEKGMFNRVFIDTNKVATVFGRNELNEYINREINKGNLVRIKNRSTQTSESTSPIKADYGMNTPYDNSIRNLDEIVNSENSEAEFALGSEPVDAGMDIEERMRRYENVPEYRPGMESSAVAEDPDVDRLLEWDRVTNDGSAKPDYEQNVPKSEFVGTPHLRELGIQIENSVGDYWGTAAAVANDRAAKQMKRQIKRAETQLNATEAEKDFAAGIASGKYYVEDIPGRLDEYVVRELAEYYAAEEALDTDLLREKKASISSGLFETMKELFRDSDAFTPSAALVICNI